MITFFRKIRYNLMNHNSPAGRSGKTKRPASPSGRAVRYFKYAIGEIILVVIGILIALQINNWNQSQKENKLEHEYLQRLKKDFEANLSESETNLKFSKLQNKFAVHLLKSLNTDIKERKDIERWFMGINHLWFLPHPNFTKKTWNELNTTGNLSIIDNKALIEKIAGTYNHIDRLNAVEKEWGDFHLNFRAKVNALLPTELRKDLFEVIVGLNDLENIDKLPPIEPYLKEFRTLEGIKGILSDIEINRYASSLNYPDLNLQIKDILKLLSQEISEHKI